MCWTNPHSVRLSTTAAPLLPTRRAHNQAAALLPAAIVIELLRVISTAKSALTGLSAIGSLGKKDLLGGDDVIAEASRWTHRWSWRVLWHVVCLASFLLPDKCPVHCPEHCQRIGLGLGLGLSGGRTVANLCTEFAVPVPTSSKALDGNRCSRVTGDLVSGGHCCRL